MSGVGVRQASLSRIDDTVKHRDEHLRRFELLAQRLEERAEHFARTDEVLSVYRRGSYRKRQDESGPITMPGSVAEHGASHAFAKLEDLIEIAANALGRDH